MAFFNKKPENKGEDISHIKLGTRIEISKLESNGKFFHNSNLEEFISEDELLILVPIYRGALIKLNKDSEYRIIFKTPKGLYVNTMQVVEYIIKDDIPLLKIKLLGNNIKIQRRDSFRLDINLEFQFDEVEENTENVYICTDPLLSKGVTEDISNGGLKFLSNEELKIDSLIKCLLVLNNFYIISIAKVLYVEKAINKNFKYSYKVKFERIKNSDKEFISKYIFEKQRESLKSKEDI